MSPASNNGGAVGFEENEIAEAAGQEGVAPNPTGRVSVGFGDTGKRNH